MKLIRFTIQVFFLLRSFTSLDFPQTPSRLLVGFSQQPGASHTAGGRSSETNVAHVAYVAHIGHVAHGSDQHNEYHLWVERVDVLVSEDGIDDKVDDEGDYWEGEEVREQAHPVAATLITCPHCQ